MRLLLPTGIKAIRLKNRSITAWLDGCSLGIRLKLILMTLGLIGMTTLGSSLVILSIMDDVLLRSLIQRGSSIALNATTPAGFSALANDQLGLDNLVAKINDAQPDVAYMVIIDNQGVVLAHNRLTATGGLFAPANGILVDSGRDWQAQKVTRDGIFCYEFEATIRFADQKVGKVILGLKPDSLVAAQKKARQKTVWIAILAMSFGVAGTLVSANLLTAPIKRLATGVTQVKTGAGRVEIAITSRDELGQLTSSFNEMSRVILSQKESLKTYAHTLEESYTAMVRILAAALDARDKYTLGHSARVAWLSILIGKKLGLGESELKDLEMSCFLHDIGKIRVPDVILAKKAPLNDEEYVLIKQHPIHGAEILGLAKVLHKYIPAVLHHHEWHNGQGYPNGLQGEEIHLYAQIVAIADCYDAMTSSRPYRKGRSKSAAIKELRKASGTQFSPELVEIFLGAIKDFDQVEEISFIGEVS
jgi:HD-GYP domain-containing protein (c-di-GMP phosphodiesterase class II)